MSGITMVTGEEGMPPIRTGVPIIDRITALHAAIGTLAALHERETSGEGQSMDVCLADTGYSMTEIPNHRLSRHQDTAQARGHHCATLRHLPLQGGMGADLRR